MFSTVICIARAAFSWTLATGSTSLNWDAQVGCLTPAVALPMLSSAKLLPHLACWLYSRLFHRHVCFFFSFLSNMMQLRQIWAHFLSIYICHLNLNFLSGILIFFFIFFLLFCYMVEQLYIGSFCERTRLFNQSLTLKQY